MFFLNKQKKTLRMWGRRRPCCLADIKLQQGLIKYYIKHTHTQIQTLTNGLEKGPKVKSLAMENLWYK
jgi:hypothetical protein